MAQGPNWMVMNQMHTQRQGDDEYDEEEQQSNPPTTSRLQELESILANNRKHRKDLDELKKELDLIGYGNHITQFYPQFICENDYEADIQKQVIEEEGLSRLLEAFQNQNRVLKVELKGWMQEFGKKTNLAELLIKENVMIKQQLNQKNKDLVKLIETLGSTYGEEIQSLEDSLSELNQQNNVLLQHLSKLEESVNQKRAERELQKAKIEQKTKQHRQKTQKLNDLMESQEHYGKMFVLLEASYDNMNRQLEKLNKQIVRLTATYQQLQNDKNELQYHLDVHKTQVHDMKKTLRKQNEQKAEQYKQLNNQIKILTEQLQDATKKEAQSENQLNRMDRSLIECDSIVKSANQKVKQLQPYVKTLQEELDKQLQAEGQQTSELNFVNYEISLLQGRIQSLVANRKKEQQQYPETIKAIVNQKELERKSLEREIQEIEGRETLNLMTKNSEVIRQRNALQEIQRRLKIKEDRMRQIKAEMDQYKKNKVELTNLKKLLDIKTQELESLRVDID